MMTKLLTTAAALAVVLPVSAHAEQAARTTNQNQERQIERSQYESERSDVRGRLNQNDSIAEQRAAPARTKSASPTSLNDASPANGDDRTAPAPVSPSRSSSYNQ